MEKIKEFFKKLWAWLNQPVEKMSTLGLVCQVLICGIIGGIIGGLLLI